MAVSGVNSSTSPTSTASPGSTSGTDAADATLNYQSFLKLLIAQMKNQDPTEPMDASEQIAQLATFSQVEQSIKINSNLETLLVSESLTQASTYIGKTITSSDGQTSGVVAEVEVTSEGVTAITTSGKEIAIEPGITVSMTSST
ncbi:flagellar basal-body rod modification protein FlgD [Sinorhizobium kostiense]|uniref:Basal-body rod modification protein FlgD n=1 Tax=Sinorhizobium kostiense TaxID=76747 RepID=A0ABS4QY97_9HYPH|nr:flagellar hook assembly protein FlgD [Sinorhizobium kostiense]MBP2235621.1 flagellar basal-body rod modification protein FlgD [Sinorhizobium kostiense]